jgi:flagellar basal-body rod protein FlgC
MKPIFETTYAANVKDSGISTTEVAGITTSERRPERTYMPNHPLADEDGFVYAAAVNVEEEFVEMLEAKRQYQNNIEVVTTLRALMMRTINMGK